MIAAVDTEGNLYLSLTQVNTDANVMLMFLSRLAQVLSTEDANWRSNTVLLLDNAPYHRAKEVKEHLLKLGVRTILSGQYAYSAAVCETFFSYYKRGDQNPDRAKTGRTAFKTIVALVYERVRSLQQPAFILFWRQAVLGLYEYLLFKPL